MRLQGTVSISPWLVAFLHVMQQVRLFKFALLKRLLCSIKFENFKTEVILSAETCTKLPSEVMHILRCSLDSSLMSLHISRQMWRHKGSAAVRDISCITKSEANLEVEDICALHARIHDLGCTELFFFPSPHDCAAPPHSCQAISPGNIHDKRPILIRVSVDLLRSAHEDDLQCAAGMS